MIQVGDIVKFKTNERSCDGVKFCQTNNITGVVTGLYEPSPGCTKTLPQILLASDYALGRLADAMRNPHLFIINTGFDYPIYAKDNELELVVKKEMIPIEEGY